MRAAGPRPRDGTGQGGCAGLAVYAALVLYATTLPFRFAWPGGGGDAFVGAALYLRIDALDAIANCVLFIPLGYLLRRCIPATGPPAALMLAVVAVGISLLLEATQIFLPARYPSPWDVLANTAGAFGGIALADAVTRRAIGSWRLLAGGLALAGGAAGVLVPPGLVGAVPTRAHLEALAAWHVPHGLVLPEAVLTWALLAYLLARVLPGGAARGALLLLAVTLGLEMVTSHGMIHAAAVLGAVAGIALGTAGTFRESSRARLLAISLAGWLVIDGLWPLTLREVPASIHWLPLQALILSDPATMLRVACEKVFLYGSLFWLLRDARLRLGPALVAGTLLLTGIEWAQCWVGRGHVAETTDPLAFLLLGLGCRSVAREAAPPSCESCRSGGTPA